jgi:PmbA protein
VIELMGQGVNYVTGDYSRGAAGFWVENGASCIRARDHHRRQPARHVQGHRRGRCRRIYPGRKTIGSVLIERMKIAGSGA